MVFVRESLSSHVLARAKQIGDVGGRLGEGADMIQAPGFGIYVHWPFCQTICPYCDFNVHVSTNIDDDAWRGG